MVDREPIGRRPDVLDRTKRDVDRFHKRETSGRFWRSLALVGSVGWPIVLLAIGGAMLGRHLDQRFASGVRFTLVLLTVGTSAGVLIAFRTLRESDG